ncbi:MAG: hypothetical protein QOI38_3181 [Sphingomonadales bacterium]|jgi:hypothetical protein|nr:hypothetical protein [Sphingomonadales bacterium]
MSTTRINVNVVEDGSWTDSMPLLILAVCVTIGIIAFLFGLNWLRRRRHAHLEDHLVVDMAEPETLRDLPADRRP